MANTSTMSSADAGTPGGDHSAVESSQLVTDTDDTYFATLRTLSARAMTAQAAMRDAHLAATPQVRTAALVDLHQQLRAMSGLLNEALGQPSTTPMRSQ